MKIKQFFLLCLFPVLPVFAGNPVDDFAKSPLLENANVSLLVSDANTGQALYQFRPKSLATPASTMKLVTTATALELLGPDFCFETKLEIDGKVSADSILAGNLYIHGGGDPTLGSEKLGEKDFFPQWIQAVKNAGIKKITGQIIADATLFDDEGVNPRWTWEDMGNYYAAGAYGISYMDNTYKLVLQSGQEGTTPRDS
ncbi:MAG: D-alanyl-D-alanine carboxypeptidase [Paludibacter sp.]